MSNTVHVRLIRYKTNQEMSEYNVVRRRQPYLNRICQ